MCINTKATPSFMGRPKKKRLLMDAEGDGSVQGDAAGEGGGTMHTASAMARSGKGQSSNSKSTSSKASSGRKRARRKKRQLKTAKQKKADKRRQEKGGEKNGKLVGGLSFAPAHIWRSAETVLPSPAGKCKKGPRPSEAPRPRDCYDESKSTTHGDIIFHSWINELSWFRQDEVDTTTRASSHSIPTQDEHVRTLTEQLESIKERMWPVTLRCASAYNALNFGCRTPEEEFFEARRVCNHFEWVGEGQRGGLNKDLFVNRSAIKLANIDALLDFTLVPEDSVTFVDLCGAPGGWSEYIMYRCKKNGVSYRGYGMSLMGENENGQGVNWKLDHIRMESGSSSSSPSSSFEISTGVDGTGDVYKWENIASLCAVIANEQDKGSETETTKADTAKRKPGFVDLVVADGGFDEQRNSTQQETLAQKIVVSQAASAMELLRPGGTFVVKMFGCQTGEMRDLVRYLSMHFDCVAFLKPISSRPASAERYLVCRTFWGVPPCWNGQAWIESILSQKKHERNNDDHGDGSLLEYLDRVDADITRLNIKVCSSILSYLENKARIVEAGSDDDDQDKVVTSYTSIVDTLAYKYAWKLQ